MNVLMLSLMYPRDTLEEVSRNAKDKLQIQIDSYQRAFAEGIRENLGRGEALDIINALPVGVFPKQYSKALLPAGWHDGHTLYELGCINLPGLKQCGRTMRAAQRIAAWCAQSTQNRTVLIYTIYLPYLQAVMRVKKRYPDLKACVIVTDLPNEFGLASGRSGLLKRIEYARGRKSMALCRRMDGFVLLTRPMAEALGIGDKPYLVIEGLILNSKEVKPTAGQQGRPAVLYSGTLEPDLGVGEMLEAFSQMPEYELWICGQGSMRRDVESAARRAPNIRYYGFVPHNQALALQSRADLLINPRSPRGTFTRYSFPSKTLEYLRSAKPVVCYRLEGIPQEYDPYLYFIEGDGPEAIMRAVRKALSLPPEERQALGERARAFILANKTPAVQCRRLMSYLRGL